MKEYVTIPPEIEGMKSWAPAFKKKAAQDAARARRKLWDDMDEILHGESTLLEKAGAMRSLARKAGMGL